MQKAGGLGCTSFTKTEAGVVGSSRWWYVTCQDGTAWAVETDDAGEKVVYVRQKE